jgi:hypothetical protein
MAATSLVVAPSVVVKVVEEGAAQVIRIIMPATTGMREMEAK